MLYVSTDFCGFRVLGLRVLPCYQDLCETGRVGLSASRMDFCKHRPLHGSPVPEPRHPVSRCLFCLSYLSALGGSWVVISGVISRVTIVITHICLDVVSKLFATFRGLGRGTAMCAHDIVGLYCTQQSQRRRGRSASCGYKRGEVVSKFSFQGLIALYYLIL